MSLTMRALVALVLFIGFYALAIALAGLLFFLPLAELMFLDRIHIKLALVCVIAGGVILWSVMPRFDRFVAPGPQLLREEHPELFATIDDVAQRTGQQAPAEVYLVHDVNAWVAQRGGLLGIGSKRVMGLGLPLMQVLSVTELRAVLAHEFGHYHGGDTALGPFIYRTRAAMARTVVNLSESGMWMLVIVSLPFKAFGQLFLRVTHAISRAQEFAADALAAQVEGPAALSSSLRTIHGAAMAFEPYLHGELAPVLGRGHRPPVAAGFARFIGAENIASVVKQSVDEELASGVGDPLDTHPPLRDRIAAVEGLPARDAPADDRRSICLLGDVSRVELALLKQILVIPVDELETVDWEDVGRVVTLPDLRDTVSAGAGSLAGVPLRDAPCTAAALTQLGRAWNVPLADEDPQQAGVYLAQAAVLVTLAEQGWTVDSLPGSPVSVRQADGEPFVPHQALSAAMDAEDPRAAWTSTLQAAGVDPSLPMVAV